VFNQQLQTTLANALDLNLARLKCLALLIAATMKHRSVNLVQLATTEDGRACSNESRYRRFQDFFLRTRLCFCSVSRLILQRIPKPRNGYLLALDRTNWEFGHQTINFLVFAIVIGNVSIPIMWKVLPKKSKGGNSNQKQRITLMKKLLRIIPAKDIHALTMDREFVGKEWLSWLDEQGLTYVVRIKKNTSVGWRSAQEYASLPGKKSPARQDIFGLDLFFGSGPMKGSQKEKIMVVSNHLPGKEALKLYRKRWGIERLFGHLKRKGFDLEATHMTCPKKLEKLFAIVVIAFTYSFGWGCHLRSQGDRASAQSKRKSLFRLGLEDLVRLFDHSFSDRLKKREQQRFKRWLESPGEPSIFLV